MLGRIGLFLLTNILVIAAVTIVTSLLGLNGYLTANGLDYQSLAIFCALWGIIGSFVSLMMSKFMAKKMMGVQIIDEQTEYAWVVRKVYEYSKMANLPKMPEVGIYESPEINAFATGPSKSNSLVAVSTGLLHSMNQDEIEGVLAHEVSHIANGDMVTMTLIQGVVNAFVMFFARIAAFAVQNAMRGDDDDSPASGGLMYYITVMVFEMVFGFLAMFVVGYFSRLREFKADSGGARLAGREKMIASLEKLKNQFENIEPSSGALQTMKISAKDSGLMKLMSTHPSLDHRIAALRSARTL